MSLLNVTFEIPAAITEGLANGTLERAGGVIRDVKTKGIVMWLREVSISNVQAFPLQTHSAASILNLGVSAIGFVSILGRLDEIEKNIKQELREIRDEIIVGYRSKFSAALKLAEHSYTMSRTDVRKMMAQEAIPKFLEVQSIFIDFADRGIQKGEPTSTHYLLILFLAYVTEARCYLELEVPNTALKRLQEGVEDLRLLVHKYVDLLLTSNPAVYLLPRFKDEISLCRFTKVYQWLNPDLNEATVFELQRENFVKINHHSNEWAASLPSAIVDRSKIPWGFLSPNWTYDQYLANVKDEVYKVLPETMATIESVLETFRRFEAYQTEVKAIAQLGISFHDWLQLAPQESQPENTNLMYIIPAEPLSL